MPTRKKLNSAQPQPFIGGIVGGIVTDIATGVIKDAVTGALDKASHDPDLPVTKDKVPDLAKQIVEKVTPAVVDQIAPKIQKEVGAIVENATNSEPLWRSRVVVGLVASLILKVLASLGVATDTVDAESVTTLLLTLASFLADAYALYGRVNSASLKPLGK